MLLPYGVAGRAKQSYMGECLVKGFICVGRDKLNLGILRIIFGQQIHQK